MKKHLSTIALILVLLAGVSLLLYPTVSDYWNARHASKAVADYTQNVQALDQDAYDELLAAAEDYNRSPAARHRRPGPAPMTSCWRRRRTITGRC